MGKRPCSIPQIKSLIYMYIYSRRLPYIYSRLANRTADVTLRNFHKADVCKIYSFASRQANVGRWGGGGGEGGGTLFHSANKVTSIHIYI